MNSTLYCKFPLAGTHERGGDIFALLLRQCYYLEIGGGVAGERGRGRALDVSEKCALRQNTIPQNTGSIDWSKINYKRHPPPRSIKDKLSIQITGFFIFFLEGE